LSSGRAAQAQQAGAGLRFADSSLTGAIENGTSTVTVLVANDATSAATVHFEVSVEPDSTISVTSPPCVVEAFGTQPCDVTFIVGGSAPSFDGTLTAKAEKEPSG